MYLSNIIRHLRTILTHKFYVAKYCFMCGLYVQGILHDLSKFSPTEFFESVKYYQGNRSPIDACKEINGYSLAWFHHRGRNKHHWEYWVDDFQKGMLPKKMPFKYALEMICDFLGAGNAYMKNKFDIQAEYDWWQEKRNIVVIHDATKRLIDCLFVSMQRDGIEQTLTNRRYINTLRRLYNKTK